VLAGGNVEDADGLVTRVDRELVDRRRDAGEVVTPELLEAPHLLRKTRQPIREPVGERRVAEAAVPPARAECEPLAFQENDRALRVCPHRLDRRPEPGEPTADDSEIAVDLLLQRL